MDSGRAIRSRVSRGQAVGMLLGDRFRSSDRLRGVEFSDVPRGIAQPGSAAVLGTAGRRFESCCPDQLIQWLSGDHGRQIFPEMENGKTWGRDAEKLSLWITRERQ